MVECSWCGIKNKHNGYYGVTHTLSMPRLPHSHTAKDRTSVFVSAEIHLKTSSFTHSLETFDPSPTAELIVKWFKSKCHVRDASRVTMNIETLF